MVVLRVRNHTSACRVQIFIPIAPYGANFFHSASARGGSYASAFMLISNRFIGTAAGRFVGVVFAFVVGVCQKGSFVCSVGSSPAWMISLRTAAMQLWR